MDLPQPVSPATITTWLSLIASTILSLYCQMGRLSLSRCTLRSLSNCTREDRSATFTPTGSRPVRLHWTTKQEDLPLRISHLLSLLEVDVVSQNQPHFTELLISQTYRTRGRYTNACYTYGNIQFICIGYIPNRLTHEATSRVPLVWCFTHLFKVSQTKMCLQQEQFTSLNQSVHMYLIRS